MMVHLQGDPIVTILAIDLGKGKSVFCLFDAVTGEVEFGSISSTTRSLRTLIERLRPGQVAVEICPLAARVYDLAQSLNVPIQVADTTQDAWKWKNVKRKTDEDDALKLARLSALGQLNLVHMPAPAMRQWRKLVEARAVLRAERTRCKNRIRALLLQEEQDWPAGKRGWTGQALKGLAELARPLDQCPPTELWRGILHLELERLEDLARTVQAVEAKLDELAQREERVELLQSIPGVGPRTAEVIVTALDDPHRFKNSRQVASYAGLTPRRFQSGQMDRSGRISKRGNRLLRWALNQAAWMAVRYNPWARAVFQRIGASRKERRKLAIVAVMRKLLVSAWAMLRDRRVYQPRPIATVAA